MRTARTLLGDDSFSGWGIRTIPTSEARYNPMSYHNGSVWPHDNALIAAGMSHYDYKQGAMRILTGLFDALSTADMVPRTKPDPAPYALAASKLGLRPEQCIAVEDSVNGITSAVRARTRVVQLRATETSAPPMDREGVSMIIHSLEEFPMQWLHV